MRRFLALLVMTQSALVFQQRGVFTADHLQRSENDNGPEV